MAVTGMGGRVRYTAMSDPLNRMRGGPDVSGVHRPAPTQEPVSLPPIIPEAYPLAQLADPASRPRRDARIYSHTRYALVPAAPRMIAHVAFWPWATHAAIPAVAMEKITAWVTYSRSDAARRSSAPKDSAVQGELLRVPYACM